MTTKTENIHITRWGDKGPTVLLIHGSAQGSRVGGAGHFSAQKALGDNGYRLVVPDRPGHGLSPAPGRPDDAEVDGAWAAEMLGEGAHLVGHSFGGCVALNAAARRPQAVRSLTLIEPGMQPLATDEPAVRRFLMRLLAVRLLSFSPEQRAARFARLVGIPDSIGAARDREEAKAMGRAMARLKIPSATVLRDQLAVIRKSGTPLMVVTGGWSPAFDAVGRRVAELGGGDHRIVRAPNHFPNLMPEFNPILASFMARADARRPERVS